MANQQQLIRNAFSHTAYKKYGHGPRWNFTGLLMKASVYNNMRVWISSLGSLGKQNPQGVCGAPQVALVVKNLSASAGDARDSSVSVYMHEGQPLRSGVMNKLNFSDPLFQPPKVYF